MTSTCTQEVYLLDSVGGTRSTGKNSTFTQVWQTKGYTSNPARRAAIVAHPAYNPSVVTSDGYTLDNVDWNYDVQQGVLMRVTLTYSHQEGPRNKSQNPPLQNVGDEETRITYGFIEQKILEAYVDQQGYGVNRPQAGRRIEYDPVTKEVKGTTRKKPTSRLAVTKVLEESLITDAWTVEREEKLYTVNNAEFRGRAAETVMFTGLEMSQRSQGGDWHVSFSFLSMPPDEMDLSTLDIGETGIVVIQPFQYPWAYYKDDQDSDGNDIPKCQGFYVATNYESTDFSTIIPS